MSFGTETFRLAFPDAEDPPYNKVSYGLRFTEAVPKHVEHTFHAQRAYLLASPSLSKSTSNVRDLEAALGTRHAGTWLGIKPHTPWDQLVPIINDMRDKKADCLITLGGGSLTDGAKMIIYALANGVSTEEEMEAMTTMAAGDPKGVKRGRGFINLTGVGKDPTVPIICVPTTLSAGEYSRFSGGTSSKTHLKTNICHPKMFPSLVVLDPELCITTPEWAWLSTGVRAVDHCAESFCSPHGKPVVDAAAKKGLKLLLANLLITKRDPQDLEARLNCQLAANYIMINLLWAPKILMVGASHGIGHQLGPLGVGHGQTSCILLPAVMKYNKTVNEAKQEELKDHIWSDEVIADLLTEAGLKQAESDLGDALDKVFRALGMPRTLADVGVGVDRLDLLATNSLEDTCCIVNPVPLRQKEQVLEILEAVVGEPPSKS